jgi:2-polyprenyl-3-methyl-5-hydroxy-6-metoxy-1,4-benzoquinol methylase
MLQVTPEELEAAAVSAGLVPERRQGMVYSIAKQCWVLAPDQTINYIASFSKPTEKEIPC